MINDANEITLEGRLTRDPELRYTTAGTPVLTMGLANNRQVQAAPGDWREMTTFIDVILLGLLAEEFHRVLKKAAHIIVKGQLQERRWEGRHQEPRHKYEIRALSIERVQAPPTVPAAHWTEKSEA